MNNSGGYKPTDNLITVDNINNSESLFSIYEWVYKDQEQRFEKIELARNIMSLKVNSGIEDISNDTVKSIKSAYKIYLKENVENYITILHQVTETMNNLENKELEIIEDFSSRFKGIFQAFFTFLVSVIILNVITGGEPLSGFNISLGIIMFGLVGINWLYFKVSEKDLEDRLSKLKTSFERTKDRYRSILVQEDIDRLFMQKDEEEDSWDKVLLKRYNKYWKYLNWILIAVILVLLGINYWGKIIVECIKAYLNNS